MAPALSARSTAAREVSPTRVARVATPSRRYRCCTTLMPDEDGPIAQGPHLAVHRFVDGRAYLSQAANGWAGHILKCASYARRPTRVASYARRSRPGRHHGDPAA